MTRATIFGSADPVLANSNDPTAGNFATAFYITSGTGWTVKGARIWATDAAIGTTGFIAYLLSGTSLATATILATSPSFTVALNTWNEVTFPSPVAIAVGTKYWVAVYCPNGKYSFVAQKFNAGPVQSVDNPVLYGSGSTEVTPGNGGYAYGAAGNFSAAASFNNTFYGVDVIADNGAGMSTVPPNLSLANSRRAYWNATVNNNNLSNADMYFKFLQIKTAKTNLSIEDMEKIYWNTTAGTSGLSVQDAKRIAFGSANQYEELYWLRAQP